MAGFADWLIDIGLERHRELFAAHDVDLDSAAELTDADLVALGLSLGHRRRFLAAAAALKRIPAAAAGPADASTGAEAIERRPVTVAFVDLVGSTALASRLDPEDLQALLVRYREAAAAVVTRHEGHVAQHLGDGLLCYFGYPRAHEDAAERAVRAALETVAAVATLAAPDRTPLACRVGIASGVVAAPTQAAAERTVVGDVPHLAARLQALADPGQVLIGAVTRELVGGTFELESLGAVVLKGYATSTRRSATCTRRSPKQRTSPTRGSRRSAPSTRNC